jgi:membrane protein implicated in regulation of membrane protease activity
VLHIIIPLFFGKRGCKMLTIYLICFWVGLILTIVTTLFGSHALQMDMDLENGHTAHGHGHSPFNFSTILAFLTGFGGTGYILLNYKGLNGVWIILIATGIGFLIAALLFIFLSKVLLRDEHVMKEESYQIQGTLGTITTAVPPHGTGEMKYVLEGTTRSVGVKGQHGEEISKGTKVVIVGLEKGIAKVTPFEEME